MDVEGAGAGSSPRGLEACHATCSGREQSRKLINHPRIINSWCPGTQSLSLVFQFCPLSAGASWGSSLGQAFISCKRCVQATLPAEESSNNKSYCLLKVSSAQVGKLRFREVYSLAQGRQIESGRARGQSEPIWIPSPCS